MGLYVDRGNQSFKNALNSKIYVDKADLLKYTNEVLKTEQNRICVTRPRCFGKSMAVDMLAVYYDKSCDSQGGGPRTVSLRKKIMKNISINIGSFIWTLRYLRPRKKQYP